MSHLAMAAAGFVFLLGASWVAEMIIGGTQRELLLSFDEKTAHQRADETQQAFTDSRLPPLGRMEILRRVAWIWKSARVMALRSGRWSALPWIVLIAGLCCAVVVKTLISPNSHNLRIILGGREFVLFLVA